MTEFECSKCGRLRNGGLFYRGRVCKVCEAYRSHLRAAEPLSFDEYESEFFARMDREARGVKVCPVCTAEKALSEFDKSGRCHPCRREERIQQKRAARRRKAEAEGRTFAPLAGFSGLHNAHVRAANRNFEKQCKSLARLMDAAIHAPWRGLSDSEAYRVRYASDNEFAAKERIRRQINKAVKKDGIGDVMRQAIKNCWRSKKVEDLFGYTIAELCAHLESNFTDGMTWAAFMDGKIHIDHIIPQAAHDLSCPIQFRACWSLENLQPMWAQDNLAKSDKMACGRRGRHGIHPEQRDAA